MDFCFFIPILFGCQTEIKPEGDMSIRVCPRCNNGAVTSARSKQYFEICFVPVVPMSRKHIWICSICQWSHPRQDGSWEPMTVQHPGYYPPQPPPQAYWQAEQQQQQQYYG
ncbi:hypothetical protein CPB83DRAFT_847668 [Crepidotus variabilis]|uniref:Zinc-ribbon 15 domain-containing protein n=1 Tax=Crepidotus variabilis TaxID=179855 RepID=A0A9P6ENY6_9AGAR|nr:hypothetical protein CPB83DRAFT_847668 [Crepidotus variabilis]